MLSKKILIISNNALSDTNSNGRTLKNFFDSSDSDMLAQFFIQSDVPDFDACKSFFRATDGQVLRSFLKRSSAGRVVERAEYEKSEAKSASGKKAKKNPFTMIVRNFVWSRRSWRKEFYAWVEEIAPELVLLQAGDSPFLFDISVEISKKYDIPLVIYNSEDYYFKKYNYFKNSGISGVFYPIFRSLLKKATKRAIDRSSLSVYISEDLKSLYDAEFNKRSDYVYTATEIVPRLKDKDEPVFSYLGNLGLNRHLGLIKIAEALQKIDPEYKLDVYGKIPNEAVRADLDKCTAIRYMGLVSYDDVITAMQNSMLVFHTESFEKFYAMDIAHGFSTKIADSLACGSCLVLYAPEHISCAKYLKENGCAVVITDESKLTEKLSDVINNKDLRDRYIEKAIKVAETNHNADKNKKKFARLINQI